MNALVRQQYDRLAKIYDDRWQFYIHQTLSFLVEWAQLQPTDRVLDVACGTGELERLLTVQHPQQRVVGVDFSTAMLAIARAKCQHLPNITFQAASATALPWTTPNFDRVICANAFHYFDEPIAALQQFQQVLNPGGCILILDWCRDFWSCQLCDWLLGLTDPAHQRCYTEAELRNLLSQAGLQVTRSQRHRFGLVWGLMALEAKLT